VVARYNGIWSPTWLFNASFTWNHNDFTEDPAVDVFNYTNETETAGLPGQRGLFTAQGIGFMENYRSDNYGFNFDTSKTVSFGGSHTLMLGYSYGRPNYTADRDRTGGRFPLFATNAAGVSLDDTAGTIASNPGALTNAQFRLRSRAEVPPTDPADPTTGIPACSACKLLNVPGVGLVPVAFQQNRGEFEDAIAATCSRVKTLSTSSRVSGHRVLA
jgi:hypothetical protein